jgi:uncharacterized protein involved in exopolysaccharide biosynthesis
VGLEETIDLRPYLVALRKKWLLILACTLLAGVGAYIVALFIPPVYEAEVNVAIVKSGVTLNLEPRFRTDLDVTVDQVARRRSLTTIVKSPEIAIEVSKHKLIGEQLSSAEREPNKLLATVSAVSEGDLIRIRVGASTGEKAALIANVWAQAYEDRVNAIYGETGISLAEIQPQTEAAKRDYDKQEAALVAFLSNSTFNQLEYQATQKKQRLEDLRVLENQLDRLLSDAVALRKRVAARTSNTTAGDDLAAFLLEASTFSAGSTSSSAGSSAVELPVDLQISINQLTANGSVAEKLNNLDILITALEDRRKTLQAGVVTQLQQELSQLQAQFEQQSAKKQELTQARDLAWSTYTTLANKSAEVNVTTVSKSKLVRIAVPAAVPQDPIWPKRGLSTLVASLLGFIAGATTAFVKENSKKV